LDSFENDAPYHRCDYRCDSCIHTRTCKLYLQEFQQTDPPSAEEPEPVIRQRMLLDVKQSLVETLRSLQMKAQKLGLNLMELTRETAEFCPAPDSFDVYNLACQFTEKAHHFLAEYWQAEPSLEEIEHLKIELDDLNWYHSLVSVKVVRALISQWDGDAIGFQDTKNSAEVALRSLRFCRLALGNIIEREPAYFDWLIDLILLANKIEAEIFKQFRYELKDNG